MKHCFLKRDVSVYYFKHSYIFKAKGTLSQVVVSCWIFTVFKMYT